MGISQKGKLNNFYGKKHTEETKRRMSEARKGKTYGKGRYKTGGYWFVKAEGNPRAATRGYMYEHIFEAEKKLGRPIEKHERVHHIDLDKLNCKHNNLLVCPSVKEHMRVHRSLDNIVTQLIKKGVINYNREKGEYEYGQ